MEKIYNLIFLILANLLDELKNKNKKNNKGAPCKIKDNDIFYFEIVNTIKNGSKWKSIINKYASYTVFYRKHCEWVNNKLYQLAYFITILYLKQHRYITYKQINNCYIDSSMIRNKNGIDCIGRNYSDKFKNGTKQSVIVTENGIPISFILVPSNVHDINTVKDTIKNSIIDLSKSKLVNGLNIGGDKGYISNKLKEDLKENNNINFITETKENSKNKNSLKYIKFLKKRYIVENFFAWNKNIKKIQLRYERYIENFNQIVYLSFGLVTQNKINEDKFKINNRMVKIYENKIISNERLLYSFL
jgi:hypothetical protein